MPTDDITSLRPWPPGTRRHYIVFTLQELLNLRASGTSVGTSATTAAEHRARTTLAHQLRTDGPEQTMNWKALTLVPTFDKDHHLVVIVFLIPPVPPD